MRLLILLGALVFSQVSWGHSFPTQDGTYAGSGMLTKLSDGTQISFTVTTAISSANGTLATHYHYANGFDYTLAFQIVDGSYGAFSLLVDGTPAGTGYCIGQVCDVDLDYTDATLGAFKASVSYTFSGAQVVATGHNFTSNTIFQSTTTRQ